MRNIISYLRGLIIIPQNIALILNGSDSFLLHHFHFIGLLIYHQKDKKVRFPFLFCYIAEVIGNFRSFLQFLPQIITTLRRRSCAVRDTGGHCFIEKRNCSNFTGRDIIDFSSSFRYEIIYMPKCTSITRYCASGIITQPTRTVEPKII